MTNLSAPSVQAVLALDSYFQFEDNAQLVRAGEKIVDKHYPYNSEGWEDPSIPEQNITKAYWAFRKLQMDSNLTDQDILNG